MILVIILDYLGLSGVVGGPRTISGVPASHRALGSMPVLSKQLDHDIRSMSIFCKNSKYGIGIIAVSLLIV